MKSTNTFVEWLILITCSHHGKGVSLLPVKQHGRLSMMQLTYVELKVLSGHTLCEKPLDTIFISKQKMSPCCNRFLVIQPRLLHSDTLELMMIWSIKHLRVFHYKPIF